MTFFCADECRSSPNPWVLAELQQALSELRKEDSSTRHSALHAGRGGVLADTTATNDIASTSDGNSVGRFTTAAEGFFPAKGQEELVVVRVALPSADEREQVCLRRPAR